VGLNVPRVWNRYVVAIRKFHTRSVTLLVADIEADEDMEEDAWLNQAPALLNATNFAARYFNGDPSMGMSFYIEPCMREALEGRYGTPRPQACAAMYVPPAATWILLAGGKIYQLCRDDYQRKDGRLVGHGLAWEGYGFSLDRWALWKQKFGDTMRSEGLESTVQEYARNAAREMERIEDQE
jgi:hypothetical protein